MKRKPSGKKSKRRKTKPKQNRKKKKFDEPNESVTTTDQDWNILWLHLISTQYAIDAVIKIQTEFQHDVRRSRCEWHPTHRNHNNIWFKFSRKFPFKLKMINVNGFLIQIHLSLSLFYTVLSLSGWFRLSFAFCFMWFCVFQLSGSQCWQISWTILRSHVELAASK